jgi:hypothetical protein
MNHALNRVISSDKLLAVSIEDAAKQCRLTFDELDDSIRSELEQYILVAQSYISEKYDILFGECLCEAIYHVGNFNVKKLYIPVHPCDSIETVSYKGEQITTWTLYNGSYSSFLEFESSLTFNKKITVRYKGGYKNSNEVPSNIKHAILMLVVHYFDNKNPVSPQNNYNLGYAVDALLASYNKIRVA